MKSINNCIKNGAPLYDINGKRIHAQFPHMLYHNGKYYLYGSNKEFSNGTGIWHWGIKMYESEDLYNWKEVGIIIPPDENDPASPLYPHKTMDAPCIIYNRKTDKWVCWLIEMNEKKAYTLVADSLFGPYKFSVEGFFPCGLTVGDFDIAEADDGKAYIYFNNPHKRIICGELTEDYTATTGKYTAILDRPQGVPYVREAPAHFQRDGKSYLITSGTTAFFPNPSEIAVGKHLGEYVTLGDPHVDDETKTSFHSQIRSVFKVPGKKDLYIALADRWLPDYMHVPYEKIRDWYYAHYHGATQKQSQVTARELEDHYNIILGCMKQDVSIAEYVFLPIVFDKEIPSIYWRDEWSLEEFE